MITTESCLGVLVRISTLLVGATWDSARSISNMLIFSPTNLRTNELFIQIIALWLTVFLPGQVSLIFVVSDKIKIEQSKEENGEMLMTPLYFKFVASNEIQPGQLKGEY